MPKRASKLVVLGLDAALPDLIQRFAAEGVLPNISRLMRRGMFSRVITTMPPLTAAAWSAIVCGAGPGTAGIPSLMVHLPGEELDKWHTSFDRRMLKAETLWEAASRKDKRTVLINWPVTWPLGGYDAIQIGAALNPPFRFFYMPLWDLASSALWATEKYPCNQVPGRAVVVKPIPARDWANLPNSAAVPLEFEMTVPPAFIPGKPYYCLLLDPDGRGYSEALIAPARDASRAVARLRVGEQSNWIFDTFQVDGRMRRGRFRFELFALAPDAGHLKLYMSAINTAETYTSPPELQEELERVAGPYLEVDDPWAYMDQWAQFDWYLDQLSVHNRWWTRATCHMLARDDWDLAFSWVGTIDHIQHVIYGALDPNSRHYDEAKVPEYLAHLRRVYREIDQGVGEMMAAVDLDDTLFMLVSDHGFSGIDLNPYLKYFLEQAGLLTFTFDEAGQMVVDWSKTKAFPLEPCHAHIFVNLKGRDPQGIVEPQDYRKVQDEIIDMLMSMRDPETGECVVSVAVRKQEGIALGIYPNGGFDRIGDVVFALKPQYFNNPFVYQASVEYPDGTRRRIENQEKFEPAILGRHFTGAHVALPADESMHAMVILAGPGIRPHVRKQPVNVVDLAPTVARIYGVPCPRDAEGNILRGVLEDEGESGDAGTA